MDGHRAVVYVVARGIVAGRLALLFVVGAIIISFFDGFHTHSGTTSYPDPVFMRMAWWVPFEFGFVTAAGGLMYAIGHRALGATRRADRREVGIAFALFAVAYFASGFLPVSNSIKSAVIFGLFGSAWWISDRTWQGLALSAAAAVGGCATEITLSRLGLFSHLQPDLWGIPMWGVDAILST